LILPGGAKNWLDWSNLFQNPQDQARRDYIERKAVRSGTPSLINVRDLEKLFSDFEIQSLKEIAKGPK